MAFGSMVPYNFGGGLQKSDTEDRLKNAQIMLRKLREENGEKLKEVMKSKRDVLTHFTSQKSKVMALGGGAVGGIFYAEFSAWVLKNLAAGDANSPIYKYRWALPAAFLVFGAKIPVIKDHVNEPWFEALMVGLVSVAASEAYSDYQKAPKAAGYDDGASLGFTMPDARNGLNLVSASGVPEYAGAIACGLVPLEIADFLAKSYIQKATQQPGQIPVQVHSKGLEYLNDVSEYGDLTEGQMEAGAALHSALTYAQEDVAAGAAFGKYKGMDKQAKAAAKVEEAYRKFEKKNGTPPSVQKLKDEVKAARLARRRQYQADQQGEQSEPYQAETEEYIEGI